MKRIFGMLGSAFVVFCVSLIICQALFLGALLFGGAFTQKNRTRLIAIMRGVDLKQIVSEEKAAIAEAEVQSRVIAPSDEMNTRKKATDGKLGELQLVENRLKVTQRRLQAVQNEFAVKLDQLEETARENALEELRNTLELLDAKSAKEIVVHLIEDGEMDDVVEVLRKMTRPKQQKLFAQFQGEQDQQHIHEILSRLRQGDVANLNNLN